MKYKVLKEALGEAKLEIFSEFQTSLSTAEERKTDIEQKSVEKVTLPPDGTNQIIAFESSKTYGIELSPELTKRKKELDRKILSNMLKLRELLDGTGNNSCQLFAMESFYFSGIATALKESGFELTFSGKKRQLIKEAKKIEDNLLQLQPELDLLITDVENYVRNSLKDPNSPLREHLMPVFFTRPFESLNFGIFELAVVGIWHPKLSANNWEPGTIQKKLDDLANIEFFKRAFIGSHLYGFKNPRKDANNHL